MIKLNIKPLSINEAYCGYRRRTPKYNKFIFDMMLMLPNNLVMPKKDIKINIEFGFSSNASDIDNCVKTCVDCLVKKYGIDDRYIIEMHVVKKIVGKQNEYILFNFY